MDIGKSFTYVFEDQDWIKKVLIGGVVNIIPIVNFAASGYWLAQTKKAYDGQDLPLPEWSDFGGYFMKGLMLAIASIVYSLPAILLYCCAFILPTFAASAGASSSSSSSGGSAGPLAVLAAPMLFCGICLLLLYALALLVFLPALFTRYALTGEFGAFFQFGPAIQMIKSDVGGYAMAVLVFVIAALVASLIGSILCGVGAFFTSFWSSLVGAYLFGNFAKGPAQSMPAAA